MLDFPFVNALHRETRGRLNELFESITVMGTKKRIESRESPAMKRVPDVVINRLSAAFGAFDIQADELMGLLKSFRRNRVRRIAIRGLTPGPAQIPGLENIPWEHLHNLAELDDALRAYAKCVTGDGHEYLSTKVYEAAFRLHQRHVARNPRAPGSQNDRDEQIARFLKKRGYLGLERGEKKSVVFEATAKFGVSESVIRRVISGLRKKETEQG